MTIDIKSPGKRSFVKIVLVFFITILLVFISPETSKGESEKKKEKGIVAEKQKETNEKQEKKDKQDKEDAVEKSDKQKVDDKDEEVGVGKEKEKKEKEKKEKERSGSVPGSYWKNQ